MRFAYVLKGLTLTALAASLAACVSYTGGRTNSYPATTTYPAPATYPTQAYAQYGRVTNVELMRTQQRGSTSGAGAVIGGVVGGALVGNALEQNRTPGSVNEFYRVSVQLDNGTMRAFDYASAPNVRIGDRVRIENDQLYR